MSFKVLSVFAHSPAQFAYTESFALELSSQLGRRGGASVLCFASPPPEIIRQVLSRPNVTLEAAPEVFRPGWRSMTAMAGLLRRHRPSVLHLHYTGFLSAYPWLARLHGIKRIFFTNHSSAPEGHVITPAPAWKRVAARAVNYPLTRVVSISEYNHRSLVEAGMISGDKVMRIYNAVDLARVVHTPELGNDFRRRRGIPQGRTVILQASWMIPEKGISDLLEAARIILSTDSNVHFVFAGEGPSREDYMRRSKDMGIEDHVTWTGSVSDPFAEGLYAGADVVCQVSRWEEGFGMTIAEAMAHGKPVVGTRAGAIPEIVQDGITGLLVNRRDPAALADALTRLIRDPELRRRLGEAGRARAQAEFDLRRYVAQIIGLYGIGRP